MQFNRVQQFGYPVIMGIFIVFAFYFLVCSNFGLIKYYRAKKHLTICTHELTTLSQDISELEKTIVAWKTDDFYVEKMAREDLAMGMPDEVVYRI